LNLLHPVRPALHLRSSWMASPSPVKYSTAFLSLHIQQPRTSVILCVFFFFPFLFRLQIIFPWSLYRADDVHEHLRQSPHTFSPSQFHDQKSFGITVQENR
jgi:hypothetical protein